jgi:hypothetical protein
MRQRFAFRGAALKAETAQHFRQAGEVGVHLA